MKKVFVLLVFGLLCLNAGFAQGINVQGNWEGEFFKDTWENKTLSADIIGQSNNSYLIEMNIDGKKVEAHAYDQKKLTTVAEVVDLGKQLGGQYIMTGFIKDGIFSGSLKNQIVEIPFQLERVHKESPTLGQKPPVGAVVLLPDSDVSLEERWEVFKEQWNIPYHWVADKDGSIHRSGGSIYTKDEFGDAQIHLEFKTPYEPNDRGQGRGNSGVYVMGRYEVQVLDSFSDEPKDNLCGGIYKFGVPNQYASYPPGTWQTYDIEIIAPRFDSNGKKTSNARITVKHNGKLIHDDLELAKNTPGGWGGGKEAPKGPLLLQDHGDTVRFKNIWIKPMN